MKGNDPMPLEALTDLEKEDAVRLLLDFFHRAVIHHALWFTEVRHQMGMEKSLEALGIVLEKSLPLQMDRLSRVFGFSMKNGLPEPLLSYSRQDLSGLLQATAVNWLANDGIWFQAIEQCRGMNDAKRCNDSCWARFSPFEAWSIKRFLNLSEAPGLDGLKKALSFRLYACINTQSFIDETPETIVFQMNDCRVQSARKRRGLPDYPCKSGGLVEYDYFARAIDSRIETECIGCPPDPHPDQWYCAWRFRIRP